jgi:sugar lactone lactonase YvrE
VRRFAVTMVVVGALSLALAGGAVAAVPGHQDGRERFPATIALPDGFRPEGISTGRGTSFYVGSLADGAIYRGDVRTGEGRILVPGKEGRVAVGTEVDSRNRLWVAGGATGAARVYDARSGALLKSYKLAEPNTAFINDVVVTRDAAYFTDSVAGEANQRLLVVPFGPGGALPSKAQTLKLSGDIEYTTGFNANGIEASPDGRTLLVVQSNTGLLFAVNPRSGVATTVDLDGASLTNGDGLLRRGTTLYVVRNQLNRIAEIRLDRSYRSGTLIREITNQGFDVPTTVAAFGSTLYAVNARFSTPPGPDTEYTVVKVSIRRPAAHTNHGSGLRGQRRGWLVPECPAGSSCGFAARLMGTSLGWCRSDSTRPTNRSTRARCSRTRYARRTPGSTP